MSFKRCRMEAGIKQEYVAMELGVDRTTVSKWDVGAAKPSGKLLPKIASLYGCTIDDLFAPEPDLDDEIIEKKEDEKND